VELIKSYTSELNRLNYRSSTIETYSGCFSKYLYDFKGHDYRYITHKQILQWLTDCVEKDKISTSYQNQLINAVKFYYETMLGQERKFYYIKRPKRHTRMPVILDESEIKTLFDTCTNIKHWCCMALMYECGLRRSEVVDLKITDVDSKQMLIRIIDSKGGEDRIVPMSQLLLDKLREYFKKDRPKIFLFNGQVFKKEPPDTIKPYTAESIWQFVHDIAKESGIAKKVHPHLLRHCYSTHQHEQGTEFPDLSKLLGHKNVKTTMLYTQLSKRKMKSLPSLLTNLYEQ